MSICFQFNNPLNICWSFGKWSHYSVAICIYYRQPSSRYTSSWEGKAANRIISPFLASPLTTEMYDVSVSAQLNCWAKIVLRAICPQLQTQRIRLSSYTEYSRVPNKRVDCNNMGTFWKIYSSRILVNCPKSYKLKHTSIQNWRVTDAGDSWSHWENNWLSVMLLP